MIISLLVYPLIAFARRRKQKESLCFEDFALAQFQICMMLFWTYLNYKLIGKDKGDFWEFLLPSAVIVSIHLASLFLMSIFFSN